MSLDYAAGLSHYDDLGVCGSDEVFDKPEAMREKVTRLANLLRQNKGSCLIHAGAGLSTAAGIRDFRGKGGVWTELQRAQQCKPERDLKEEEEKPDTKVIAFDQTKPTIGHMALRLLCDMGYVSHIVSQNVDGLFLKTGLQRKFISELHGNFYLDECTKCKARFVRSKASETMRLTRSSVKCPRNGKARSCSGHLRDTILDWESPIPYNELRVATRESKRSKLHLCIGTSMQLRPSKDLVCNPLKSKASKLVVINLQPTNLDPQASLVINYYADDVMSELAKQLDLEIPEYDESSDPTKRAELVGREWRK